MWGQIIGGALTAYGQYRANKESRNYATKMSGTAHQRQMADLKAAGINPMLAGRLGGASTPSYQAGNIGSAAVQGYGQVSSAKQAQAQTQLTKEQTQETIAKVKQVIPATVEKLRQDGLLAQAKISVEETKAIFNDLTNKLTRMDVDALKKMGLSPMQLKHKPSNQIGSMLIEGMLKVPEITLEASNVGLVKTKTFLGNMLDWAYKNKMLDRKTYEAQIRNLMRK